MKRIFAVLIVMLLIFAVTSCDKNTEDDGLVLTGILHDTSTPVNKDYQIAYLKCEGNIYAIVIPEYIKIECSSYEARNKVFGGALINTQYHLDWGLELTVVCGEETEATQDEPFWGPIEVNKWYTAKKVSISGVGEWQEALDAKPVIYL